MTARSYAVWPPKSSNSIAGQLRVWPGGYDDYVLQKRAALDVEAKHAALFDKKLAQEEAWIRQGVEARRTRNEGRVRALKQLRIERRERRERIGSVELRAQEAAPSGKLVFEAQHVRRVSAPRRSSAISRRASCARTASASLDPTAAARPP